MLHDVTGTGRRSGASPCAVFARIAGFVIYHFTWVSGSMLKTVALSASTVGFTSNESIAGAASRWHRWSDTPRVRQQALSQRAGSDANLELCALASSSGILHVTATQHLVGFLGGACAGRLLEVLGGEQRAVARVPIVQLPSFVFGAN